MSESLLESFGSPPFRFTPETPNLSSPAYTTAFKLLSCLIVAAASLWLAALWNKGALGSGGSSGLAWFATGLALMLYTVWHILTSTTRLDTSALHQSWVWDKQMELRELAYCKLIRVRGLDWLIAPRLYARTLMGKFSVFYAADPRLIAEFERLVREVAEFRRL
jgi:hypothetical protein